MGLRCEWVRVGGQPLACLWNVDVLSTVVKQQADDELVTSRCGSSASLLFSILTHILTSVTTELYSSPRTDDVGLISVSFVQGWTFPTYSWQCRRKADGDAWACANHSLIHPFGFKHTNHSLLKADFGKQGMCSHYSEILKQTLLKV